MGKTTTETDYHTYQQRLRSIIPKERIVSDPLRTLAYGTDASFYRLIPRIVIRAETEKDVINALKIAGEMKFPVTFRAAGTSLSGQAVSDSILLVAGENWKEYTILDQGARIRLQPGIIGGQANMLLAPFGMKIGPDPASINAAMIGGIAANNASGMCCGTAQNSYQTLNSMRIIFADGTLLDTSDEISMHKFSVSHSNMISQISKLADNVKKDQKLSERIRHKFKIKNTTGYSLNALVEYNNPIDIMIHLMIGSEGTLGFISEIVYNTVADHAHKATSLMIFATIEDACKTVFLLKDTPVQAVELMDRAALCSVENKTGIPEYLKTLPSDAAALLVETQAEDKSELEKNVLSIEQKLNAIPLTETPKKQAFSKLSHFKPTECEATLLPFQFTDITQDYTQLWNIRKGLFPAVGSIRQVGTTVIIEDVAFPLKHLASATIDLQILFKKHGYHDAIIFGHALEGNLHFVFTQDFNHQTEVDRYQRFMDDICLMVVEKYDGSLKAEHGTGRNMAPFVELEWGKQAYELMQEIKHIFDPENQLNPGVILTDNNLSHIQNLKPMPPAHTILDTCIECGFCEASCPSKNLSLTPRQRIVIQREISRLKTTCENPGRLKTLEDHYRYMGEQTCAADGLCASSCPVEINTGEYTKNLRGIHADTPRKQTTAKWIAGHFNQISAFMRTGLKLADITHDTIGSEHMYHLTRAARKLSNNLLPAWNRFMPRGLNRPDLTSVMFGKPRQVVYFPSCINMSMGPAKGDPDQTPLYQVVIRVLQHAGFDVILPPNRDTFCCGTPFESKGFIHQANKKARELEMMLLEISQQGHIPILCDTGPCVYRMKQTLKPQLEINEPFEFIARYLLDHISVKPETDTVAIHITCSSRKMGLESVFHDVTAVLAADAIFPPEISCCGWAGDRGFNFPELTASALETLKPSLKGRCKAGYTNSRTCEIGLSQHSGIYYKSIFYLLDHCIKGT